MKKRTIKPPRVPHPVDAAIGAVIRDERNAQTPKVTQDWLARECACSVTLIQKYERGETRVSMSRFFEIAKALGRTPAALVSRIKL